MNITILSFTKAFQESGRVLLHYEPFHPHDAIRNSPLCIAFIP